MVELEINRKVNKNFKKFDIFSRFDLKILVFVFYFGTTFISSKTYKTKRFYTVKDISFYLIKHSFC